MPGICFYAVNIFNNFLSLVYYRYFERVPALKNVSLALWSIPILCIFITLMMWKKQKKKDKTKKEIVATDRTLQFMV